MMQPFYCLIREYSGDYLSNKLINFQETGQLCFQWDKINILYYTFSQLWKSLFKIDIFEFRALIKNEIVIPRLRNCNFDKIFYDIKTYLDYIEDHHESFFLYAVDNDDFLLDDFRKEIDPILSNDEYDLLFWNHYDWLGTRSVIEIHDPTNENWQIHSNNYVYKNVNDCLIQHWEIQYKFFPDRKYTLHNNKIYIPECFSLKNTNLTAYTACINLHDDNEQGPILIIQTQEQLLECYRKCLCLPENFSLLPHIFQQDIKNMIELYKTLL
jgi:hypothetical protein